MKSRPRPDAEFVRLWTAGSRRVHAYILTLVTNCSDADDLLQDVGVTVWEKFHEYDQSQDFVAWACGIAYFKVLGYFRDHRRPTSLTEPLLGQLSTEMAVMGDLLERQHLAVKECLAALPSSERLLIRLRYTSGCTIERIAEQSGRTVAACYKALQRIHDRLFQCASRKLARE